MIPRIGLRAQAREVSTMADAAREQLRLLPVGLEASHLAESAREFIVAADIFTSYAAEVAAHPEWPESTWRPRAAGLMHSVERTGKVAIEAGNAAAAEVL